MLNGEYYEMVINDYDDDISVIFGTPEHVQPGFKN